jgi:hypothetical protein
MIINNEAVEEEEEEARVTGTRMRSTHNTQLTEIHTDSCCATQVHMEIVFFGSIGF